LVGGAVADYNNIDNFVAHSQTNSTGQHAIYLAGAKYNIVKNVQIIDYIQKADNTYDGIYLESIEGRNSEYNRFDGVTVISTENYKHRYAVYEADDNQNYNTFRDVESLGHQTDIHLIQGNHSSWNGQTPEQTIVTSIDNDESSLSASDRWVGFSITLPITENEYQITDLEIKSGTGSTSSQVVIGAFLIEANPTITDSPLSLVALTENFTVNSANTTYKKPAISKKLPAGTNLFLAFNIDTSRHFMMENPVISNPTYWDETFSENPEINRSVVLKDTTNEWYVKVYFKGYK